MSFGVLPTWAVLAGLAVLAGGFYALQRLRVRHRDADVVTLLFWREAVEEAQVRVFRRVFKHWWAYALILGAAALLWLAAADPRWPPGDRMQHVILLDGSAVMARPGRFEQARATARRLAERLPESRRRVLLVGGATRTLVGPGEAALLLDARLDDGGPVAAPGGFDRELRALVRTATSTAPITVHLVGDAPVDPGVLDALPDGVTVQRVAPDDAGGFDNRGIVALGVAEAARGGWDAVDLYIETAGGSVAPGDLGVAGLPDDPGLAVRALGRGRFVLRDLPASGAEIEVRLAGSDALAFDDAATVTLPRRPLIAVALGPDVPASVRAALALDPAVRLVNEITDADVWIGPETAPRSFAGPVLVLTLDPERTAAFTVRALPGPDGVLDAGMLLDELALAEIDANALATDARRVIRLEVTEGAPRAVTVWRELLGDGYDFAESRAFPLFIAAAVRWLAGYPPLVPWTAAGEAVSDRLVDEAGRAADGAGGLVAPAEAGRVVLGDGRPAFASLQDPSATQRTPGAVSSASGHPRSGLDLVGLLGLLAAALLACEWVLFRRGRIP